MKKTLFAIAAFVTLATTSCKKKDDTTSLPPNNNVAKAVLLQYDDYVASISYNTNGTISKIETSGTSGPVVNYNFSYNNNKISEITGEAQSKWVYTYTLDVVTKIELKNNMNQVIRKYEYTYSNNLLTEIKEYTWQSATNATLVPETKTSFYRNAAGNITKTEYYDYLNNNWVKSDESIAVSFDNKNNTITHLEFFPYLPTTNFTRNNPTKIETKSASGTLLETELYEYTYNTNNNPITRKKTIKSVGMPDFIQNTRISY